MTSGTRSRLFALGAIFVVSACSDRGGAGRDPAPKPAVVGDDRGTVPYKSEVSSMIEVKADEAQAKGLARVAFRVDPAGTPLMLRKFPEADKYLIASGPPGGPLLAIVWATDEREADGAALERAVRKHFSQPWLEPLEIGAPGNLTIAGASRAALAFTTGKQIGRTGWCGVIVPAQDAAVFVTLGRAAAPPATLSCEQVVAEPSLATFARTFELVP